MTMTHPPEAIAHSTTDHTDREALLAAARRLEPLIREHTGEAERTRRLSPKVTAALDEAGLFRLLLPRSLGGLEVDPVTFSHILEEVASFDSAAGWALQAGNAGAYWAARLPTEGVEEIYGGGANAPMAAAFHPPQQAVETKGGYLITGRGPLASNIHDSQWLFLTALVMDGEAPRMVNGMPRVLGLVIRASEVDIVDTWDSLGMRGTDSNDVVMKGVFVPRSRTFPLVPEFQPSAHHGGALYRFPVSAPGSSASARFLWPSREARSGAPAAGGEEDGAGLHQASQRAGDRAGDGGEGGSDAAGGAALVLRHAIRGMGADGRR